MYTIGYNDRRHEMQEERHKTKGKETNQARKAKLKAPAKFQLYEQIANDSSSTKWIYYVK